jgi:autotransporter-associated beta strand protein
MPVQAKTSILNPNSNTAHHMKKTSASSLPKLLALALGLAVAGISQSTQAATDTWSGAINGVWDTATTSNWLNDGSDTLFNSGNDALFTGTPTNSVTAASGLTIGSITLQSGFTGSVTLTGANTVNGTTTVNAGTLTLANNNALGSSAVTLNGGKFNFSGGAYTITNTFNVTGATEIQVASAQNEVLNGNFSGAGNLNLTQNGTTGQWQFGGDNSGYTGTFTQNSGNTSLAFNAATAGSAAANWVFNNPTNQRTRLNFGAGTISFGSLAGNGSIANVAGSGMATVSVGALDTSTTFSGILGGSTAGQGQNIALTKVGTGALTLSGANTHTGGTIVSSGTLILAGGAGSGTGRIRGTVEIQTGAILETTGSDALGYTPGSQVATVNVNGGTFNNASAGNQGFATNFSLTGGSVTSTGGGSINFTTGYGITSNASSTTSTFSAPITLRTGNNMGVIVAAGTTGSGVDMEISGAIGENQGTGALTKTGAGTLVLSNANTYLGATSVSEGSLIVSSFGSLSTGAVSVASAAAIGGDGTIGGSLSLASGAKFVFSLTDTLTVNGASVTFGGFSVADLVGLDSSVALNTYTLINGSATIDFANVSNVGIENAYDLGAGKSAYFQSGSLQLVVVPEPGTFAMLLGGLGMLTLLRRRRA